MEFSPATSSGIESESNSDNEIQFEEGVAAIRAGDLQQVRYCENRLQL